jgi:hypothetical protein
MTTAADSVEEHHQQQQQQTTRTRGSKKREITLDNIRTYMPSSRPQKRPYTMSAEELPQGHNAFQTVPNASTSGGEGDVTSGAAAVSLADEVNEITTVSVPPAAPSSARDSDVPPNLPTPFRWKGMTSEESNHQLTLLCQALIDFVEGSEVLYTSKFKLMHAFIAAEAYPPHMKGIDELMIKNKLFFASKKAHLRTKAGMRLVPHEELLLKTIATLESHVAQSKTPGLTTDGKSSRRRSSSTNQVDNKESEDDEKEEEEEEENTTLPNLLDEGNGSVIIDSTDSASVPSTAAIAAPTRINHQSARNSVSIPPSSGISSFRTVPSSFNNRANFAPPGSSHAGPAGTANNSPYHTNSGELVGLDPSVLNSLTKTMDVLGRHINSMATTQASASANDNASNSHQLKALGDTLATLLTEVVECKSSLRGIESKLDYLDKKIDILNNSYRDGLLQMQKSLIESLLRANMPDITGSNSSGV